MTVEIDGGRLSLVSDTRAELHALARLVVEEPDKRRLAGELVPLLATVSHALTLFDDLVEAVAEQEEFENNPTDYLFAREFPLRSCDRIADSLADAVTGMLDLLTAGVDAS